MAHTKILGEQLDIVDITNDIAADSAAIGNIATGISNDPGATASLDASYLRRDGGGSPLLGMLTDLDVGTFDIVNVNIVDGRNVSADGTALDAHLIETNNPHSTRLDNLVDVVITGSPAAVSGDALVFDGTNWVNQIVNTSSATWGNISGLVINQTDLQGELDLKVNNVDYNIHVGDFTNPHIVTQTQVGLDQVDNTADLDKPTSALTQAALDTKFDGTFTIQVDPTIRLETTNNDNILSYFNQTGGNPVFNTPRIVIGEPGQWITFDSGIGSGIVLKNNSAVQSWDDTYAAVVNLISRTDKTANTAPTQGPTAYNNEVIVGDGGVTTAIRSGTVGTNDPIVRAGAFGATDDWKIWHEGNLDPTLHVSTSNFNIHTTTDNAHNVAIANLTDVALAGSPPTIINGQVLTWDNTNSVWVNTTPSTGVTDHALLANIGTNSHVAIDTHIADATIHFSTIGGLSDVDTTTPPNSGQSLTWNGVDNWVPSDVDHDNLANNGGTGSHAAISNHIADPTIHFSVITGLSDVTVSGIADGQVLTYNAGVWVNTTPGSGVTDHTLLTNIGTNTHADIDTHIADATVHFTEATIDHVNILNKGTNTHAQIDAHIVDIANPHATTIANLSDVSFAGSPGLAIGEFLSWDGTNWINSVVNASGGTWGTITGTLSDQTDLNDVLVTKFDGTFNVSFADGIGFTTTGSPPLNILSYDVVTALPLGITDKITVGDVLTAINVDGVIWTPIVMKNDTSLQSWDNTYTNVTNLVSRAAVNTNVPPTQGPTNYNNEVIVGDSGVTTAIRSGTVGTDDPVVRAGAFGATDDWKIWHEGNLINPAAHLADTANPHATTIANLTDTNITAPTNNQVLTYNFTNSNWEPRTPTALAAAPQYEKQIVVGAVTTVIDTTIPTTAATGGKATLQVFRNGALQEENISGGSITNEDFDVTGANQITFANALIDADKIIIYSFE